MASIVTDAGREAGRRTTTKLIVVLEISQGRYELAYGRQAYLEAHRSGRSAIQALVLSEPAVDALETFSALSSIDVPEPSWIALASAVRVLRQGGVPSVVIAPLLRLHPADITRLAELAEACRPLQELIEQGHLSPGHARHLTRLPHDRQVYWAKWCVAHRASVRELKGALSDQQAGRVRNEAPDLGPFLTQLSERLGTEVQLDNGELRIGFFSMEELKGCLEQLAAGPELELPILGQKAWLRIPVKDNDQLHSLTGHLIEM
ncbi:ParB/RepB/Spo0J family partition protein [Xanthomonas euvesicatoria]